MLASYWALVGAVILFISFIFCLMAVQLIMRNRVYFSASARYINDQRGLFLAMKPLGFGNQSGYYTDFTKPAPFDRDSSQFMWVKALELIGSFLFGLGVSLVLLYVNMNLAVCFIVGFLLCALTFAGLFRRDIQYLERRKPVDARKNGE